MDQIIICPTCKIRLNEENGCDNCLKNYQKEGYIDLSSTTSDQKDNEIIKILKKIEIHGYELGLKNYFCDNQKELEKYSIIEGDIAFRSINKRNKRCLVLNSDIGNVSENLSNIFEEVYSLERKIEKILFQKMRYQELDKDNIILIKDDSRKLPFPEEHFDLVVLNGINFEKGNEIIEYFNEIKRVITYDGCFCLGTKNNLREKIIKNKDLTEEIYNHNYNSCMSILKNSGFFVKSSWNFGTLKRPYFLIDLNDENQMRWFFKNLKNFFQISLKVKIIFWFLKKFNMSFNEMLVRTFGSSFVFYCYKNDVSPEFEAKVREKITVKSFLQQIRTKKISFILFNKLGKPEKKMASHRMKNILNQDIDIIKNHLKKVSHSEIIIEDWIEGKPINITDPNETELLIKWIIDFQEKTSYEIYDLSKIKNELIIMKEQLKKIDIIKKLPIESITYELEKFFGECNLKSVTSHGDLAPHNILINNSKDIKVIDWEDHKENINPFKDISKIIFHMYTPNFQIDEFKNNLETYLENPMFIMLKEILEKHFKVKINLILLLQYFILNHIITDKNSNMELFSQMLIELLNIEQNPGTNLNE